MILQIVLSTGRFAKSSYRMNYRKGNREMKTSRLGLPVKVIVTAVTAITFITTIFGIYRFRNESSESYRNLDEKIQNKINMLFPSLEKPLFDYDEQTVKDILLPQMEDKAITGLFISN
ncbi:MAG: hypothetical protein BWK80_60285, partial [Desulfobacteraceae bacterium IS3]